MTSSQARCWPTLLDCLGVEKPVRVQGDSLRDICAGNADPHKHKDYVYAEHCIGQPFHGKLKDTPLLTSLRSRTAKLTSYSGVGIGELYDLQTHPHEHENLLDSPQHRDLKMGMMKQCFDMSVLTQDPLPVAQADW